MNNKNIRKGYNRIILNNILHFMFKRIYKIKNFIKWKEIFVLLLLIGVAAISLAESTFVQEENGTTNVQEEIVTALAEPAFASEGSGGSEESGGGGGVMNVISEGIGYAVASVLSIIAYIINAVNGLLITLMIQILVNVASFDHIIDVPTVQRGWLVVRDICNMSFILIFLFIAFATILRIESFSVKKALPKLLIVAVLINFSRSIFGIVIDFSQVIMLSFVNTFSNGQGWFIDAFNTQHINSINTEGEDAFSNWETVMAIISGVFASTITLIVITVMVAVLIIRLVLLWVYTILSPLAFLGFAFDPIKKYVGFIWTDFIKQVTIGPILAFFIWLALTTVNQSATQLGGTESELTIAQSAFFTDTKFQAFLISIALLMAGLMVAQQMGGAVGSIAGKGIEAAKGKAGPTPMRWGRERWDAFQKKRESERKGKAEKFGESAHGLYKGVSQQPVAAIKGAQKATGFYPGEAAKEAGKNIPGIKWLRQKRQNKKDHEDEFFKTFDKGETRESEDGNYKYKLSPDKDKVTAYKKDEDGLFTEKKNEEVTSMGRVMADYKKGHREGFTPAGQIKNDITKKRLEEEEGKLKDSSQTEIKDKIKDKNASSIEKQAAGLHMLRDQQFKEGEQELFDNAKENVKRSPEAKRDFDSEADKHYAAWNNTKKGFERKIDKGEVQAKSQNLSQFASNPKRFADALGDQFGAFAQNLSDSSAHSKETVKNALSGKIGKFEKVDMSDSEQKQMRNSYANVTGDINKAFSGNTKAQQNYIRRSKPEQLNKVLKNRDSEEAGNKSMIDNNLKQAVSRGQFNNLSKQSGVSGDHIETTKKLVEEKEKEKREEEERNEEKRKKEEAAGNKRKKEEAKARKEGDTRQHREERRDQNRSI